MKTCPISGGGAAHTNRYFTCIFGGSVTISRESLDSSFERQKPLGPKGGLTSAAPDALIERFFAGHRLKGAVTVGEASVGAGEPHRWAAEPRKQHHILRVQ